MKYFKEAVLSLCFLLLIVILMVPVTNATTNPESKNNQHRIKVIDEKIDTVVKLAAGSTAASAVVSMLPGDTGTPIAEELAELGKFFILVLSALYLEKYLITITGLVAFRFIIPLALAFLAIGIWRSNAFWRSIAVKLTIFGLAIHFVVPISVKISDVIYDTYSTKIQETVEVSVEITQTQTEESEGGFLDKIGNWVSDTTTEVLDRFSKIVSNFIEALAVMIVTSCLIPLLVIIIFAWLVKTVFVINLPINTVPRLEDGKKFLGKLIK